MLRTTCTLFSLLMVSAAWAAVELPGPDGKIVFKLATSPEGNLLYSVSSQGKERLQPARAGLIIDNVDVGAGVTLGAPTTREISEVFPWRGNKTTATNHCRASELAVRTQGGLEWTLEVRVFKDGAAFRYRIPGAGERRVNGEPTAWQLPPASTVWYQTDTLNYEGNYRSSRADHVPLQTKVRDHEVPTHIGLPMTIAYEDGSFGLLSEAALFHYSGMTLRAGGSAKLLAAFEDDPQGWLQQGTVRSPWRVVLLSPDLNGLINNDVIPALCDPPDPALFPKGMNTEWIRPGKAPCTWMVFGNDGAQWDRQKWFVDLCAATGCEYLLVDAGWRSEKWGWLKNGGAPWAWAAELCQYAAERKVGIVLWHPYPEGRDDSPGLTSIEAREEFFRNCQKAGVKGVKIDFFDSESKQMIDAYEDLLKRAAKYQLMINFHGAHKPTGEPRTWPHEITREGIREQEYALWSSLPLTHYGALPFTRMAAGHADFLPGYVQKRLLRDTTSIFQMAGVIVFSSPFLCWPDNPEAYLNSPLLDFVRTVPVTWDETRILPGSVIGETVIMARRKGADWHIGVLNCKPESRTLQLDLSFIALQGKEMTLYSDGPAKPSVQIQTALTPPADGKLSASLLGGGGFIVQIREPRSYAGWR